MTTLPGVGSTGSTAPTARQESARSTAVDYESFLQLLVEQMKNQDPTKPMDSTDYVAQLANFSNVEQAVQTNSKLDELLAVSTTTSAASMIGRTLHDANGQEVGQVIRVTFSGSDISVTTTSGETVPLRDGYAIS